MAAPKLKIVKKEDFVDLPLPERIKVGPFYYRTRWFDELESFKTGNSGYCDDGALEIGLLDAMPPQRQAEVLLHEVLHACFNIADLRGGPMPEEEKIVTTLTFQMLGVYRDNPDLMAWLDQKFGMLGME
ncbi:hypothetical protein [Methylobacterium sp. WL120]|uniref:hypothetical protein n=1 Tax=Methylobacterium sp. WL120 TaxID=2603887 RepID=UPI0011C6F587|nr:hypothetical protein [Methylobacterium sp. WL120]TXM68179.1 hypothetical protein FV229_08365 [Methylobacterium sp. WL120]